MLNSFDHFGNFIDDVNEKYGKEYAAYLFFSLLFFQNIIFSQTFRFYYLLQFDVGNMQAGVKVAYLKDAYRLGLKLDTAASNSTFLAAS